MHIPFIRSPLATESGHPSENEQYLKENLAAMAIKLGQMQAQLFRLDALGERVQGLSGVKPEEFNFKQMPGTGGSNPSTAGDRMSPASNSHGFKSPAFNSHSLNMSELQIALDAMSRDIGHRADYMDVVETTLMSDKIKAKLLPTNQPVSSNYNSSSFGWRLDPFSGRSAFHEGLDFPAVTGAPIVAAAAGVVIAAELHPAYGNMLDIDHGNDIVTRYAHTSILLVKVGDIVRRGQHIADVGNTGRSTGPHLHFEVRIKGSAQDPRKFLAAGTDQAKMAALIGN
ncbi:M23 family metallopeptidase [Glaciimonas immobilis]|uniref:Murein DD-endopeptidase MepM/ murein hydrolase activator NlpD n=1 Tax=Glaciimonas immobilis TaxID=728004 RepID=A0A840RU36_9BURK|nr:M23 family metallopeptidase [Glaciimonas immobilis]MBB5200121.1 murein DD-endopeptidase MepM/ murein hydrolase activator NlpD [Glaciimonas immobilis]